MTDTHNAFAIPGIPGFQPNPDSLTQRMLAWFEDNPGDGLTVEDCATKFGVDLESARHALQHLVKRQKLAREPSIYVLRSKS
jgi:hypothetical protein